MEMSRDVPLCYRTLHPWRMQGKKELREAEQTLRQVNILRGAGISYLKRTQMKEEAKEPTFYYLKKPDKEFVFSFFYGSRMFRARPAQRTTKVTDSYSHIAGTTIRSH